MWLKNSIHVNFCGSEVLLNDFGDKLKIVYYTVKLSCVNFTFLWKTLLFY